MKHLAVIVSLTVAVGLALPARAVDPNNLKRAQRKVTKAQKLLEKEQFARAEKLCREAISIEPVLPSGHLCLGAALVGEKNFVAALPVLDEAQTRFVAYQQELEKARLKQKQVAYQQRQEWDTQAQSQGIATSGHAPTVAGGSAADTQTNRRVSTLGGRDLAVQEHLVEKRWEMDEFSAVPAQVFYLKGVAYLRTGKRDQGMKALSSCLERDKKHGLAHYNLAVALFMKGDAAGAKSHLDAARSAGVKPNPRFVADVESKLGN